MPGNLFEVSPYILNFVSISFGAFAGALFGYFFARHKSKKETQCRQKILLVRLRDELNAITDTPKPYQGPSKVNYLDPFRLVTPHLLLGGLIIDYRKHEKLMEAILSLQVSCSKYNDFVFISNLTQAIKKDIEPEERRSLFEAVSTYRRSVVHRKSEVLKLI